MKLFSAWFIDHFLAYAPSCRPLLLLLDGHASHFCPEMIKVAAAEKVILFTLPPNATHLAQPLDKSCFSPLKSQVVHEFTAKNHRAVTRYNFSSLLQKHGILQCLWRMYLLDLRCAEYTLSTGWHLMYQRRNKLHLSQRHYLKNLGWSTSLCTVLSDVVLTLQVLPFPQPVLYIFDTY